MSERSRKKLGLGWLLLLIFLPLADLALLIRKLLHGKNIALLNPKGLIAHEQLGLMKYSAVILLVIAVPSVFLLYSIAWKYRESNTKASYEPTVRHGTLLNFSIWAIPSAFMLLLALVMWPATHRLEPQTPIASDTAPLRIQVVSMRWKWLFIYPEQHIASVNFLQIPINRPIQIELTADEAPMSSFWIPNLAGQLYTMTGHVNRLNLITDTPGDYPGSSAEINGAGFSKMKFTTRTSQNEDFDLWVDRAKQAPAILDATNYDSLLQPSQNNPIQVYSDYEAGLYDKVVMKYSGPGESHTHHE